MPDSRHAGMPPANTIPLERHAAATLQYIRAAMEAAASLTVPGSAAIAVGSVGLLAAALSSIPGLRQHWLVIWIVAAVVADGMGSVLMIQPASLRGLTLVGPVRKFGLCLLPSLLAGAVLTVVHWVQQNPESIPGTWLMLYGCALIAASAVTGAALGRLGAAFFACGVLALFLPLGLQILLLGAAFGGLHLGFGLLLRRGHGRAR